MSENNTILIGVRSEPTGNAPAGKVYIWVEPSGTIWTKDDTGNKISGSGVTVHNDLTGKDATDQHIISAITGLQAALDLKQVKNNPVVEGRTSLSNGTEYGSFEEDSGQLKIGASNAVNIDSNALILKDAVGFEGRYLTIGENGLITYTKPTETPDSQEDFNAGPVSSTGTQVDLGISIVLASDFKDPTVQWSLTFENQHSFASSSVTLQGYIDGSPQGPAHNYEVGAGATALLTGALPIVGTMASGSVLTFRVTSSRSGEATNINVIVAAAGSSITAEWGQITGVLSSQTDLQTALDNKADISTINIFGTYSGNAERRDVVTNSSATPVTYISNTVTAAPAGRYRVGATVGWALNSAGRNIIISWKVNGVIFGEMEVEPKDAGSDIKHINSGFDYIDHLGGDILLEMEFAPEQSGDVATMFSAALEQWRVS